MTSQVLLHAAGWQWWFAPFWILFWVAVVLLVWRLAPWRRRRDGRVDARSLLAERFARGEIDAAEYSARLEVLGK